MTQYVIRRLLAFIPTLLIVAALIALLIDLIPGDPVELLLGQEASSFAINKRRDELGLDRPIHERLLEWVGNALRGDLGQSLFLSKSVTQTIRERYSVTIWLTLFALAVASLVGIAAGIVASVKQGQLLDWLVTSSALIWLSIPGFWIALQLILFFAVRLRWFPVAGFVPITENPGAFFKHLILPGAALGLGYSGIIARFARTSMLEVLRQDYMSTARAKGLRERVVLLRHGFRNALIPILTMVGIGFGDLLGGAVIVETVFSMPGVGRMILDAVKRRDYPLIQGGIFVVTATYLLVNLLTDLAYAWVDPRIRYD
jgi:peptide/nickel transport system permease protein